MAAAREVLGHDRHRARAAARVAALLRSLSWDVGATVAEAGDAARARLMELPGVGSHAADRILEFLAHGRVAEHRDLLAGVPTAVLRERLEAAGRRRHRLRLGTALPIARLVRDGLVRHGGGTRVEIAGALRRGCEVVDGIELIATAEEPRALLDLFLRLQPASLAEETTGGARIVLDHPSATAELRLGVVAPESWGAGLAVATGSAAHVDLLTTAAAERGLTLSPTGLVDAAGQPQPCREEEELYRLLELAWLPPELREPAADPAIDASSLVTVEGRRSELHAHTTASDGRLSIEELAACAREHGLEVVAVTDHSAASAHAGGLDAARLREHVTAIRAADRRTRGIRILAGAEVDILPDGRLDYDDELLATLDVVIASPHAALDQPRSLAMRRLRRAIEHPLVHILGHPTGRHVLGRSGLDVDLPALAKIAAGAGTALEINANPRRLDLRDEHVRIAVGAGCLLALNTDAHGAEQLDGAELGVATARRGGLTPDRCLNYWSPRRLLSWLEAKS